jgi:hypothetical protein
MGNVYPLTVKVSVTVKVSPDATVASTFSAASNKSGSAPALVRHANRPI